MLKQLEFLALQAFYKVVGASIRVRKRESDVSLQLVTGSVCHPRSTTQRRAVAGLSLVLGFVGVLVACDGKKSSAEAELAPTVTGPALSATAVSAAATSAAPAKPKTAWPPREPLNVILFTIDSLRADMPWTGYERKIAPNLSKLIERSVLYPNGYSLSSQTAKSTTAMLTGRYPSSVYRSGYFFAGFSKANLFFSEVLQERGVRTLGGHAHMYFKRGANFSQGFDLWELTPGIGFNSQTDEHVTSPKMSQLAIKMLSDKANTKGQFFMWFHWMDPHDKYIQHKESPVWGKKNRDRYDSEVFFTDHHIGKVFEFGEKQDWWERTAIIISADHGEAFGEHGMYKHAFRLWEVLTKVPIIIYAPGVKPQRIEHRRSQIDFAPTVLELMGVKELPQGLAGESLVPEIYGLEPAKKREPIVLDLPEDTNNNDYHAIIQDNYKLIVAGRPGRSFQLYDLEKDPGESKNLAKEQPQKLEAMKELYEQTWSKYEVIAPYGGMKLSSGKTARGPKGPPPEKK